MDEGGEQRGAVSGRTAIWLVAMVALLPCAFVLILPRIWPSGPSDVFEYPAEAGASTEGSTADGRMTLSFALPETRKPEEWLQKMAKDNDFEPTQAGALLYRREGGATLSYDPSTKQYRIVHASSE